MKHFFMFIFALLFFALGFFFSGYSFEGRGYSDYLKGVYLMQAGQPQEALNYLEKAKKNWPESVYIRHKVATALVQQEKIEEAILTLEQAKKIDPAKLDTYLALIFIYTYQGDDKKAEAEYENFLRQAREKSPYDLEILSQLAQLYFYQQRLEESTVLYEKILQVDPKNLETFFWLGYLYYQSNREQEAMNIWKEGLEVQPSYAPILNAVGYTYAEKGIKLDKAKKMIEEALLQEPYNGAYLDSLGWVYFKKGDLEKAKKYVKEALNYVQDPEIYHHLGIIYIELSEKERGLEIYRKGLEKFPDYQELRKELEKYGKEN